MAGRGNTSRNSRRGSASLNGRWQLFLDHLPADIEQVAVFDARRASRFAGAAGQAAVEVAARLFGDRLTFENLLDQVDAPARPVQLVAEQLVGRTGRGAETAMHTGAQDFFGLLAGRGCRG